MTEFFAMPGNATDGPIVQLVSAGRRVAPDFIKTVVDGGAGIGDTTQPLIETDPSVAVYAYDPLPENAAVLRERFVAAGNVHIREVAISDKAGVARFAVPARITSRSGSWAPGTSYGGHLQRPGLRGIAIHAVRTAQALLHMGTTATLTVPTVRLDVDLPEPPDVVKLDLQGTEPIALAGLGDWLRVVKAVQAEAQFLRDDGAHVADVLGDAGFTIYLGDLQFTAKAITEHHRDCLAAHGVNIGREISNSQFDVDTLVLGTWAHDKPLPFANGRLTQDFRGLLNELGARYFQTDLIGLNDRYSEWSTVTAELSSAK